MLAAPAADGLFAPWLIRWRLVQEGAPIRTPAACLLPVRQDRAARMLNLALAAEQEAGAALLECWGGDGAIRVRARSGPALLMGRAESRADPAELGRNGADAETALIIAGVAHRLHAPRAAPLPPLRPLSDWFAKLPLTVLRHGSLLAGASLEAQALLATPQDAAPLHGDPHHGNHPDFGRGDWRAIDPKGHWGEPAYDLVPPLLNPDLANPTRALATCPGPLARLVAILAHAAGLDPRRLLRWAAAGTGLSAAWSLAGGDRARAAAALSVAEAALAEIDQ